MYVAIHAYIVSLYDARVGVRRMRVHLYKRMRGLQDTPLTNCYRDGAFRWSQDNKIHNSDAFVPIAVSLVSYCRNVQRA